MGDRQAGSPDHGALYLAAEQQSGYFAAAQARLAGFSRSLLSYHVHSGRFVRVKPHVYRLVQFPASLHEDLYAAWLELGAKAVVSHDSALALYDLSDLLPAQVHLTVPRTASRRHPGIRLHTKRLSPQEITRFGVLPVTTIRRTLVDVGAAGVADEQVRLAISQALRRGLIAREDLLALAGQRRGRLRHLIVETLHDDAATAY